MWWITNRSRLKAVSGCCLIVAFCIANNYAITMANNIIQTQKSVNGAHSIY